VSPRLDNTLAPRLVFDPGTLHNLLCALFPHIERLTAVHKPGWIRFPNATSPIELSLASVLFDSGASDANYIDEGFVHDHHEVLAPYITDCKHAVRLGDHKTHHQLSQVVRIPAAFLDSKGREHSATVECSVFSMPGTTMIIGLPDILLKFLDLYLDMLHEGRQRLTGTLSSIEISDSRYALCEPTWSINLTNEESPEEKDTPDPCSFTGPLYYLSKPRSEALDEYFAMFESHISKAFIAAVPEIENLLRSDQALAVFLPEVWKGINGITPIEIEFSPDMPTSIRPKARPINPQLYANAEAEFKRLMSYFYTPSDSSIASCLVIAPKATAPFIRLCGDYITINRYIRVGHYTIPNVSHQLQKASGFSVFIDLDWTNSFHQLPIGIKTSNILSIQTPWGLVRPKFVPEGVGPASGLLQRCVMDIFSDFDEWTIAIFDNLLVLAHDFRDAYDKLCKIIRRCADRHVVLKFSKSWFGFDEVTFFGYLVKKGTYEMSTSRKAAIMAIPMPSNMKAMQRFLGAALFFRSFLPNYSSLTAPLHDMATSAFDWNSFNWKFDYRAIFETFKEALVNSVALHFPDYNLVWILRTDASDIACASVLFQVTEDGDHQPIAFHSHKFSAAALSWDTHKKEAFGIFHGVKQNEYLLRPKRFIIETDHANLLYLEQNTAPIITRWRVYLQSFDTVLRHIAGKRNIVADWMSRQFSLNHLAALTEDSESTPLTLSPEELFSQVHGGRRGHWGARRTWSQLCQEFPGHNIPFAKVEEMIKACPTCQKARLRMSYEVKPTVRHLKPPDARSRIGVDTLTVTPEDIYGNQYCIVVVEHFTKYTSIYPAKDHNAITLATALFQHFCRFGVFEEIITDPGSDYMSEVVLMLCQWFGIKKLVSLVDRHESNGVEPANAQILRHLRALVQDERIAKSWSSPTVLPLIEYFLNYPVHSETGLSPMEAKFGTKDLQYFRLPDDIGAEIASQDYLQVLNKDIQSVRDASHKYQQQLVVERTAYNPIVPNTYQPGDFILFQASTSGHRPTKLTPEYLGPYVVIKHDKNDVTCKHLVNGIMKVFHSSRVKLFEGTRETAYDAALRDNDQYVISKILAYRGDPKVRTTMEFEVLFEDGTLTWRIWDRDLFHSIPYEDYCRSKPELHILVYDLKEAREMETRLKRTPITSVTPGDEVYVDLRSWGPGWYSKLDLPDKDHLTYVVKLQYTNWANTKRLKLDGYVPVFDERWEGRNSLDGYFVYAYGSNKKLEPNQILITEELISEHPRVLKVMDMLRLEKEPVLGTLHESKVYTMQH